MIKHLPKRPKELKGLKPDLVKTAERYLYPRIEFYKKDDDLYIFFRSIFTKRYPSCWCKIKKYRQHTALDIISKYDLGRHFNDGILQMWKSEGLKLGWMI